MKAAPVILLLAMLAGLCAAREAPPAADDPALERRVVRLASDLRCLVCQNQSLADSHADLAMDLKNQVREQMRAGRSDAEIRAYMVARYGDFVLYDPPFKLTTALLWLGPFLLLALGLAALGLYLRNRGRRLLQAQMTPAEHARAEALLRGEPGGEKKP